MTEMPLLVIEILSPRQGTGGILEKFEAYFALGIPSSWLVDPLTQTVHVYQSPTQRTTFSEGDVVDPSLPIQMPMAEIFG
jgi:Uma2 family endonuclease